MNHPGERDFEVLNKWLLQYCNNHCSSYKAIQKVRKILELLQNIIVVVYIKMLES